jgi:cell division inhibitor SulA|tara:strand:+ start:3545 stop:4003 length:459 start_codon:yes stop_codon:yes gene_type:complete
MIAVQQHAPLNQHFLHSMGEKAKSFVEFHAYDSPLLNQWHHLIASMRANANKRQWVTLINPPFIPNDQYLNEIGLGDYYVRIIRLAHNSEATTRYIQRCVQNGKSSIVAVWSNRVDELPEVLLNESPLGCQALVFSAGNRAQFRDQQLEIAF